jgi:hypothetical protein
MKYIVCLIPVLIFLFSLFTQTGYWTRIMLAAARKKKDPATFILRLKAWTLITLTQYVRLQQDLGLVKPEPAPADDLPIALTDHQLGEARIAAMKIVNLPYVKRLKAMGDAFEQIAILKLQVSRMREKLEAGNGK